jgi:hypothetical protein
MTPSLMSSLEQRRALLTAALGFMQLDHWNEPKPVAMTTLARWLDSWTGIGAVAVGMTVQGYNGELRGPLGRQANLTGKIQRRPLRSRVPLPRVVSTVPTYTSRHQRSGWTMLDYILTGYVCGGRLQ